MADLSSATTFLESVAGYNQDIIKGVLGSAAMPNRLAVIDPSYVYTSYPTTLPKVTFEGEDTLSEKRYPVVGDYWPLASDRVLMVPVGNTYVILGTLNTPNALFAPAERGKRILTGTVDVTIPSNTSSATSTVSLPSGFYTTNPRVYLAWNASTGDSAYPFFTVSFDLITSTGFTIRGAYSTAGNLPASRSMNVDWMTVGT